MDSRSEPLIFEGGEGFWIMAKREPASVTRHANESEGDQIQIPTASSTEEGCRKRVHHTSRLD